MARKRSDINPASGETTPDKRRRPRVSVYLNEDGTPDWAAVPDDQRAALGFDVSGNREPEPEPVKIEPGMVAFLMDTLTRVEAGVVSARMGIDGARALEALTPPEPIQKGICDAGARVLNKYSASLGRWQDEIALALLVVTWQTTAFTELRRIAAETNTAKETSVQRDAREAPVPDLSAFEQPEPLEA